MNGFNLEISNFIVVSLHSIFKTLVAWFSEEADKMAPRYEICVGLEKGHKTTKNALKAKPCKTKGKLTKHNKVRPRFDVRIPNL